MNDLDGLLEAQRIIFKYIGIPVATIGIIIILILLAIEIF